MPPEPITAHPPRAVRTALSSQVWQDVAFLHWPCDPQLVRPLLPPGTEPDVFDGVTWLGVVGLRMARVSLAALPPLPYLGDFLETNVRGYAVDREGRRGTVFLTMEASRLPFVLNARVAARLPYAWSWMGLRRDRDRLDYRLTRH